MGSKTVIEAAGGASEESQRRAALTEAAEIAYQGRANAAARCVTEAEVDAAVEDALRQIRSQIR